LRHDLRQARACIVVSLQLEGAGMTAGAMGFGAASPGGGWPVAPVRPAMTKRSGNGFL
jgi:hypothetical protein